MAAPSNLGELRDRIARDLGETVNNDLSLEIDDEIQAAIKLYSNQPLWFLHDTAAGTTVINQQPYTLPADLVEISVATIDSDAYPLAGPVPFERFRWRAQIAGKPQFYSLWESQMWLSPPPNAAYGYKLYYKRRLGEMTSATDTNAWITEAWRLIRSHVEWSLMVHRIHAPPTDPQAMYQAAQVELQGLLRDSRGRMTVERGGIPGTMPTGPMPAQVATE